MRLYSVNVLHFDFVTFAKLTGHRVYLMLLLKKELWAWRRVLSFKVYVLIWICTYRSTVLHGVC